MDARMHIYHESPFTQSPHFYHGDGECRQNSFFIVWDAFQSREIPKLYTNNPIPIIIITLFYSPLKHPINAMAARIFIHDYKD